MMQNGRRGIGRQGGLPQKSRSLHGTRSRGSRKPTRRPTLGDRRAKGAPGTLDVAVGRMLSKKVSRARTGVQVRPAVFACQDRVWGSSTSTGGITTSGNSVLQRIAERGLDRGKGADPLDRPTASLLSQLTLSSWSDPELSARYTMIDRLLVRGRRARDEEDHRDVLCEPGRDGRGQAFPGGADPRPRCSAAPGRIQGRGTSRAAIAEEAGRAVNTRCVPVSGPLRPRFGPLAASPFRAQSSIRAVSGQRVG